jgi:hypothetical protein
VDWFRRLRPDPVEHDGAEARERTRRDGKIADDIGEEARRLSRSIRELREKNHFAESIANLLKGRNK